MRTCRLLQGLLLCVLATNSSDHLYAQVERQYAEIQIIDDQTNHGVPLVELETVNHLRFVSDNAGRVAIGEPGWLGRKVFFYVRSHGYEYARDGFGMAGTAVRLDASHPVVLRIKRRNIAERMYRITGEGLYRDSVMLNHPTPLDEPLGAGRVVGQDSAFAVPYREQLFWFWGDTNRFGYPLGHYGMAGATSLLPGSGGLDPSVGINLSYFVDQSGFSSPMCRMEYEEGMIWADAFATVSDTDGQQRLVCHYAHMQSLERMQGHGLALFNDEAERFERFAALEMKDRWRWPAQSHVVRQRAGGTEYLLLGEVFPTVRVPATLHEFVDLNAYQAWTCLLPGSTLEQPRLNLQSDGRLKWSWQHDARPVDHETEQKWVDAGILQPSQARSLPRDVVSGESIRLHRGSVNWNSFRNRWILIACEQGGDSNLGEIWYSEADEATGPWKLARKVVTHDQYSFYNPVHHVSLDAEGGRYIYFEGTYTNTFSGNPHATPRYNYNQIMYRLDLNDSRLHLTP